MPKVQVYRACFREKASANFSGKEEEEEEEEEEDKVEEEEGRRLERPW